VRVEVVGRLGHLVQARASACTDGVEILVGELTLSGAAGNAG
jgi:hypothetical protein